MKDKKGYPKFPGKYAKPYKTNPFTRMFSSSSNQMENSLEEKKKEENIPIQNEDFKPYRKSDKSDAEIWANYLIHKKNQASETANLSEEKKQEDPFQQYNPVDTYRRDKITYGAQPATEISQEPPVISGIDPGNAFKDDDYDDYDKDEIEAKPQVNPERKVKSPYDILAEMASASSYKAEYKPQYTYYDSGQTNYEGLYSATVKTKTEAIPEPEPIEEEEVIINVAELADYYTMFELQFNNPEFKLEDDPEEYNKLYQKHFDAINSFKRSKSE